MSMDYIYLLSQDDVSEDREERKDCRKSRLSVYDKEWHVVDLQSIGQVSYTSPVTICMGYNDHFMSSINEFLYKSQPRLNIDHCAALGRNGLWTIGIYVILHPPVEGRRSRSPFYSLLNLVAKKRSPSLTYAMLYGIVYILEHAEFNFYGR